MADIWYDVDAALAEVPVNLLPLISDSDFKTIDDDVNYDAAGMDLVWNFVTTAGAYTQTAVTPTSGGNYDWTEQGNGMFTIEIPASGGASINNDTEGFGWFTGVVTGILPFRGPVCGFRASGLNDKLIDSAYSATRGLAGTALPDAAADAAGGLVISDAGGLDIDAQAVTKINSILEDTGTTLQGELDGIQADTEDIQTRLPAALVGGRIDATVDGTGMEAAAVAAIADGVWDEAATGHTDAGKAGEQLWTDVDAILVDTGTTLQAEVDGIQADTEDIQARLPAALTAGGNIKADSLAISGDTTAADRLEAMMDGILIAQVNDAAATTTAFAADGFTEATDDHFNGRLITFISGALSGQQTAITDYDAAGHAQGDQTLVVTALTEAPAENDFFVIH